VYERRGHFVIVWDLDLAIYCFYRGLEVTDARRVARGRHEIEFADRDQRIRYLQLEYANNRPVGARDLLSAQRDLKKLIREHSKQHARSGSRRS